MIKIAKGDIMEKERLQQIMMELGLYIAIQRF